MQDMQRDFKGVWIPKEIWLNENLTMLEKVIYVEIDSLDNEEHHCTAGNEYLANFCGCSESKVSRAIKKLHELGLIEIISFNGRHRKLCIGKKPRQHRQKAEAAEAKGLPINKEDKPISKKLIGKEDNKRDNPETFKDLYNEHCYNLPKVRQLSDKRIKAIRIITSKYSREDILEVLDKANDSDFLTGNNDRGWTADIDFILREDKFLNILEGKYDGKKKKKSNDGLVLAPRATKEDRDEYKYRF